VSGGAPCNVNPSTFQDFKAKAGGGGVAAHGDSARKVDVGVKAPNKNGCFCGVTSLGEEAPCVSVWKGGGPENEVSNPRVTVSEAQKKGGDFQGGQKGRRGLSGRKVWGTNPAYKKPSLGLASRDPRKNRKGEDVGRFKKELGT